MFFLKLTLCFHVSSLITCGVCTSHQTSQIKIHIYTQKLLLITHSFISTWVPLYDVRLFLLGIELSLSFLHGKFLLNNIIIKSLDKP